MRIFAINDQEIDKTLGYFIWFEKINEYHIELCEDIDEWDFPFILDHFARKKQWTVDQYYTHLFICQRIIPSDRQNLGMILKENGLEEYDEVELFVLADGRCAQDECYIRRISYEELPEAIRSRLEKRIVSLTLLKDSLYLVSYVNGKMGTVLLEGVILEKMDQRQYKRLLEYYQRFQVRKSGSSILLGENPGITYDQVYARTDFWNITSEDMLTFAVEQMMSTQDVIDTLDCTRQNVNDLVKRGKIHPLEINAKVQLFSRSEFQKLL